MADLIRSQAAQRFEEARRRALFSSLLDAIRRQPHAMLPFDEVRQRLNVRGQIALGLQTVPLHHIVGSEGRYDDFDRRFLPRRQNSKDRWTSIARAMMSDTRLPPVELWKIGDIYFVRDGNHRVSAARMGEQEFIDAYVTELRVDVPLDPDISVRDLILKEEYSDFLEWTNLHALRPDERIEFTELGGYLDLVRHINTHRYYMGQNLKREIERDEAITDWYDNVYMPMIQIIRRDALLEYFPKRTEADLYLWIMEHRATMLTEQGSDPGPEQATRAYLSTLHQSSLEGIMGDLLRRFRLAK